MLSNPYRRILKITTRIFIIGSLIVVSGILIFEILEYPRFIELDIPSPMSHLPNGDWHNTAYTTLVSEGSYQRYFIWRREGSAFGRNNLYNFDTKDDVLNYFEVKLGEKGWFKTKDLNNFYKCPIVFPDLTSSLKNDVLIEQFNRRNEDPYVAWDYVCVLIQGFPLENQEHFTVVLASLRTSPWTYFINAWH